MHKTSAGIRSKPNGSTREASAASSTSDFRVEATLDGEALTEDEVSALLAGTDGLALLRGQWVEVDRARLEQAMTQFSGAESLAAREGVSFAEAMRMLAGAAVTQDEAEDAGAGWAEIAAGPWLAEFNVLRRKNAKSLVFGKCDRLVFASLLGFHPIECLR